MTDPLTNDAIDPQFRDTVYEQDYSPKPTIEGVTIIKIRTYEARRHRSLRASPGLPLTTSKQK